MQAGAQCMHICTVFPLPPRPHAPPFPPSWGPWAQRPPSGDAGYGCMYVQYAHPSTAVGTALAGFRSATWRPPPRRWCQQRRLTRGARDGAHAPVRRCLGQPAHPLSGYAPAPPPDSVLVGPWPKGDRRGSAQRPAAPRGVSVAVLAGACKRALSPLRSGPAPQLQRTGCVGHPDPRIQGWEGGGDPARAGWGAAAAGSRISAPRHPCCTHELHARRGLRRST